MKTDKWTPNVPMGKRKKVYFHRSGRHLILTGLSIAVSFLIGLLAQFWGFGLFFGILLLSLCLWHYLAWNRVVKILSRKKKMNIRTASKEAWGRINSPHASGGHDDIIFDPTFQSFSCNIWHKHD